MNTRTLAGALRTVAVLALLAGRLAALEAVGTILQVDADRGVFRVHAGGQDRILSMAGDVQVLGLKPLNEMTAADRHKGEDGGLYGGGTNDPPPALQAAARKQAARVVPLGPDGRPSPDGKIGLVSISMSNATQEYSLFKRLADEDPRKSDGLVWERADLGPDGTHPSESGRRKVAGLLLRFFAEDPSAAPWFAAGQNRGTP
jgi:hypothetical protein